VKRFLAPPSPLPCVQWWRLCLDEAQMVECTGSKTAEMARRLGAVHRWAITGTPVQKSMHGEYDPGIFLCLLCIFNHALSVTTVFFIFVSHICFGHLNVLHVYVSQYLICASVIP
jgi:hypothetical protein